MIAHIAGVPLEEVLPSAGGAAGALVLARGWLWFHWRRRKEP